MNIDFEKVERDLGARVQDVRVGNLDPIHVREQRRKEAARDRPLRGRPPKNIPAGRHYTRIGFDPDVWYAMRNFKAQSNQSFQDQVNGALRAYLGIQQ
ncbi:MAG: hypothetical protein ACOC41_06280 [Chitinivibrionales bacterium]